MSYASHHLGDTIVALATPAGVGAIGVVRLSGPQSIAIVDAVFRGKTLAQQPTHTAHFGTIRREDDTVVDEVLATLFVSPKSYTGENTVEVSCHGSQYIIQELIQLFIRQGARLAQPGEFTLRAFLNGRMDLSQAEAVADLIASDSAGSHQLALRQMRGGFSHEIAALRQELIDFASLIELELDFGEEDVEFANRPQLKALVHKIQGVLRQLIQSFQLGNVIKQGVTTVIAGRPNAGKSTLLNALLNEERAIVSEIAGTTRDTIEEVLNIKGIQFRLIDTAGIREAEDTIEALGVAKTLEKVRESSLLVYVFDVVNTSPEEVQADLAKLVLPGMCVLVVANKVDLTHPLPPPYEGGGVVDALTAHQQPELGGGDSGASKMPRAQALRTTAVSTASEMLWKHPLPDREGAGGGFKMPNWMTASPHQFKRLKHVARVLRKNQTEAEKALWYRLRNKQIDGVKFLRQQVIGCFIVDFYDPSRRLIIEVDGSHHMWPEVYLSDMERTAILEAAGYSVIRFTNDEVLDDEDRVIELIRTHPLPPPFEGGGVVDASATHQQPELGGVDSVASKMPMAHAQPSETFGASEMPQKPPLPQREGAGGWVPISAKADINISLLKEKLYGAVLNEEVKADHTIVSNARHYEALEKAYQALDAVVMGMQTGITSDFIAMDIRRALHHLGEITGEISTDDLLGNIFGRFCIGK